MGILNLTNNSFFDGKKYNTTEKAIEQARKMIEEGAGIIDLGAQSSKPGSEEISKEEEWGKLKDVLIALRDEFNDILISIDTYRSEIAEKSINNGADIINDISAGDLDEKMFSVIAKYNVPYIIMHMQNTPKNMQKKPVYHNVVDDILSYFEKKIKILKKLGINNLIIDPGFGFGKTINHNYEILNNLDKFKSLKVPILIGTSRKSMIYNLLECEPESALNGTTITNTLSLTKGANILRVHDVKEAVECIKITNFAKNK
ncbi:MAG: dihydropteroate synthase [Flavobacteriales bacterium]|nr:dihydropteroate synthase [Flavobacteriales bacterium]